MQIGLDIAGIPPVGRTDMRDQVLIEIHLALRPQPRQLDPPVVILVRRLGVLPEPMLRAQETPHYRRLAPRSVETVHQTDSNKKGKKEGKNSHTSIAFFFAAKNRLFF